MVLAVRVLLAVLAASGSGVTAPAAASEHDARTGTQVAAAQPAAAQVAPAQVPAGPVTDIAAAPDADATMVLPPTETVSSPDTADCSQKTGPPPAQDESESVPTGQQPPPPLPVPSAPVGGSRLAACGFAVPRGSPALPPDISAAAWMIADLDTGDVLAGKDPHGRYRPASTLKLLTMNVLLRTMKDLNKVVIGTQEDADQPGSRVGLGPGGRYTVKQLMTFLLLGSGNDAAHALATANGGVAKTVQQMNAQAKALGALDTRAATVSGLDGPGQVTSAYDLALIARSDMTMSPFDELIATKYAKVPGFGEYPAFSIANENKLLFGYSGALGGKTGFTDDAGNTFVGMAERDGHRLVVTMLAGTQQPRRQWMQAASLLDWGFTLPPGTTPLGRLVSSESEATAAFGTPSLPPVTPRADRTIGGSPSSEVVTYRTSGSAAASAAVTSASGGKSAGSNVIVWIIIVLLALMAAGAVVIGLRGPGSRDSGDP